MEETMTATLPKTGLSKGQIDAYFDDILGRDPDPAQGAMSCYCMKGSEEIQDVLKDAYLKFFHHNGVVRRMMPGVRKMEEDLLSICAGILGGGTPGVVANITSGGSESIFCAIHAIREWAQATRNLSGPVEIVAPWSAHPAFSKACHYLGVKLVRIPLGPDYRANIEAMAAAITTNTVALVGSAPCWPYGLYDSIEELSELAQARDLWLHVDACVGGYLAPFVAKAGYPVPRWDFSLPGVKSISADLHKYAYAAKPASTIAWRSADLQEKYHYYSPSDWPGSPYITQAVAGSRPIGPVAAAYAVLNRLGEEGYVELAGYAMRNKERLLEGVARIPGLRPWKSDLVLTYYDSVDPNLPVKKIVGGLGDLGWPSFGTLEPPLVQVAVDPMPADGSLIDRYLADLNRVVDQIRAGAAVTTGELKYAD
jgi:glutamate/tyrosine decarboxylase-like PLP-dependent enzyme